MEREVIVGRHEAGNKMIFESLNGAFGGVPPVEMGWDQLEPLIFVQHVVLEVLRAFIVKNMHLGVKAPGAEQCPNFLVGVFDV